MGDDTDTIKNKKKDLYYSTKKKEKFDNEESR